MNFFVLMLFRADTAHGQEHTSECVYCRYKNTEECCMYTYNYNYIINADQQGLESPHWKR